MRQREFLSPSSIALFFEDREKFYIKYLADTKLPEEEQTKPMAVGSAFDAYVKSYLHEAIFGKDFDPAFNLNTIFEAQVIPANRDWARGAGKYVFEQYENSGALQNLLIELVHASEQPRFEFEVKGIVDGYREGVNGVVGGVPLLGKPDVYFKNKDGTPIIYDWKVNGFCSKYAKSPNAGYMRLRHCDRSKPMSFQHKDVTIGHVSGVMISKSHPMEHIDDKWASQLCVYGWLLGENIGSQFITGIHQIVAKPQEGKYPILRVAEHITVVSEAFQKLCYDKAQLVWKTLQSGHIFFEKSREESDLTCQTLEQRAVYLMENKDDPLFKELTQGSSWG